MNIVHFDAFRKACLECAARSPTCVGWVLSFDYDNLERDWRVTATSGRYAAYVDAASPVASTNVATIIANLAKMLCELETGEVHARGTYARVLDELAAPGGEPAPGGGSR